MSRRVGWPCMLHFLAAGEIAKLFYRCFLVATQLTGFLPITRRELSPRPMPSSMRPPEIKLRVRKQG